MYGHNDLESDNPDTPLKRHLLFQYNAILCIENAGGSLTTVPQQNTLLTRCLESMAAIKESVIIYI